jgi:hypothetical protein
MSLPGDDLIVSADLTATRAITVRASAGQVWPWIAQLGQGRGGFYSYDFLENLAGCDIHSADRIVHLTVDRNRRLVRPPGTSRPSTERPDRVDLAARILSGGVRQPCTDRGDRRFSGTRGGASGRHQPTGCDESSGAGPSRLCEEPRATE